MTTLTTKAERLQTLEAEIREGLESFYQTGMKLKAIRDEGLFREAGFATWEDYLRERWELSRSYVHRLIEAADCRDSLPALPMGNEWSERSVRELARIPDKSQAATVAEKVIEAVRESTAKVATDPNVKPLKPTAATVRQFVDAELGVKAAKPDKPPAAKPREINGVDLTEYIRRQADSIEGVLAHLQTIGCDAWHQWRRDNPQLIARSAAACSKLSEFLQADEQPTGDAPRVDLCRASAAPPDDDWGEL